jgi:DNA helicase-2/ATP-dependent DNA helicase PcrA
MYVGMTRAEKKLTLTYTRSRKVWGSEQHNPPSRFLKEIPPEFVEMQTSQQSSRFMQRYAESARSGYQGSGSSNSYGAGSGRNFRRPAGGTKNEDAHDHPSYEDFSDEVFEEGADASFKKGMRIRHPTFGIGTIFKTDGLGDAMDVSVVFGDNSVKKFRAKYARLERA